MIMYMIMCCPKYEADRRNILITLTEAFPVLEHWNPQEIFIFMMQCHDWEVTDALSKILSTIQKERGCL